eukprot:m.471093 g.471093  ORF g.471093 m.471093 type:complete len:153 (-) comp20373_c0_seq11:747-1205(-)
MLTQTNLTQSSSVHAGLVCFVGFSVPSSTYFHGTKQVISLIPKTSLVAAFTVMLKQTVRGSLFSVAKDREAPTSLFCWCQPEGAHSTSRGCSGAAWPRVGCCRELLKLASSSCFQKWLCFVASALAKAARVLLMASTWRGFPAEKKLYTACR